MQRAYVRLSPAQYIITHYITTLGRYAEAKDRVNKRFNRLHTPEHISFASKRLVPAGFRHLPYPSLHHYHQVLG